MVWFVCDSCQQTMKKNKVEQHAWSCGNYSVSCVDCNVCFPENEYTNHNSCVSEAEKYQGKLYKPKQKRQEPVKTKDDDKENRDPLKKSNAIVTKEDTRKMLQKFCKSEKISKVDKLVRKKAVKFVKKQYKSKGASIDKPEKTLLKSHVRSLLGDLVVNK